jgi:hypothetical protein
MQGGVNGTAHDDGDSRWMSYAELAEVRRITTSSAIRLVVRRGWRRQKDNQGVMRALVPVQWTEPAPGKDISQAIQALEASMTALRERAEAAERAVDTERERADRAEVARRAELSRGNFLRDRIDALRTELAEAAYALEEARREAFEALRYAEAFRHADERWQSLGRFARIREAWRNGTLIQAGPEE